MSSGSLTAAGSKSGGGRGFMPGPHTALIVATLAAALIATLLVIGLANGGKQAGSRHTRAVTRYGQLPSWLPNISNGSSKLEVARPAAPVLHEAQGYTVRAELPHGTANITAVGPQIPSWVASTAQAGGWPEGKPVPGRFIVTVIDASGAIPVSANAFTILTDAGQIVHPRVTVEGGRRLPLTLHPGQHLNLAVQGGVAEGSGSIRWAPLGQMVLVGWVYQAELD